MITTSAQEDRILALAQPVLQALGLEIVRVRIMGSRHPLLQIMIEKTGGAPTDVEDCALFSRRLSPILETEDPIHDAYRLEVSTPGIDRPLTRPGDFGRWVGQLAKVELAMPVDGRRRFQGTILREDADGIALDLGNDNELVAQLDDMTRASLVLTDELIGLALSDGSAPPQPGDETFDDFETIEDEDDIDEDTEESGV